MTLFVSPGNARVESASPFCVKVARGLNHKQLRYTVEVRAKRLRALVNPLGKLPVLQVGGDLIADSTAILAWLERLYPAHPLLPTGRRAAAEARILEDWADQSLYYSLMYLRWLHRPNWLLYKAAFMDDAPREHRSFLTRRQVRLRLDHHGIGRKEYGQVMGELRQMVDDLDALLDGREFLVGDRLSIADLAIFAMVNGLCVGSTPDAEQLVKERPNLWGHVRRIDETTGAKP